MKRKIRYLRKAFLIHLTEKYPSDIHHVQSYHWVTLKQQIPNFVLHFVVQMQFLLVLKRITKLNSSLIKKKKFVYFDP